MFDFLVAFLVQIVFSLFFSYFLFSSINPHLCSTGAQQLVAELMQMFLARLKTIFTCWFTTLTAQCCGTRRPRKCLQNWPLIQRFSYLNFYRSDIPLAGSFLGYAPTESTDSDSDSFNFPRYGKEDKEREGLGHREVKAIRE